MRIISIVAPGNGSGKTMTLGAILRAFPRRLHAVKFTTVFRDGVHCPRTEVSCACRTLDGRYTVVTDPEVIAAEGTDTGRLSGAGALSVLWCLTRPDTHEEAWRHLKQSHLPAAADLITEGNSIVPHIRPDLIVMVMSPSTPRDRWKPDTEALARSADFLILNDHDASERDLAALAEDAARMRDGRRPVIQDVSKPLETWSDPDLGARLADLLAPGSGDT